MFSTTVIVKACSTLYMIVISTHSELLYTIDCCARGNWFQQMHIIILADILSQVGYTSQNCPPFMHVASFMINV